MRHCGWRLADSTESAAPTVPVLADARRLDAGRWIELLGNARLASRRRIVLLGLADPAERARLLRLGFGDVLEAGLHLTELEARVERVRTASESLPRTRRCGRLLLDLFARDGFVGGRRLALHPREFAVLWRLAETPGTPVSRTRLIAEVWLLAHPPETNSVAVHVYRLRRKMTAAGLAEGIRTTAEGAYVLSPVSEPRAPDPAPVRSMLEEIAVTADDQKR